VAVLEVMFLAKKIWGKVFQIIGIVASIITILTFALSYIFPNFIIPEGSTDIKHYLLIILLIGSVTFCLIFLAWHLLYTDKICQRLVISGNNPVNDNSIFTLFI
jgi:magnesium-transporting ATPase (P-type)